MTESVVTVADDDRLHEALAGIVRDVYGADCRIVSCDRRSSQNRSSFALEELDLRLDDGTELTILLKNTGPDGLLPGARGAKPDCVYDPMREIEVYRTVLPMLGIESPRCLGAVVVPHGQRYWLFLEKIYGRELFWFGDLEPWREAARWLAALHGQARTTLAQLETAATHLLVYDAQFYRQWAKRAHDFLRQTAQNRADTLRLDQLFAGYDTVVEYLSELPITFIHGEFYPSNILIREAGGGLSVCPVDWEMAAFGPGLIDLAALTAGNWTSEQRSLLIAEYESALSAAGSTPPSSSELHRALKFCRLQLAVQWLGWSRDWTPPPEHAHDWLSEAVGLADELGLCAR